MCLSGIPSSAFQDRRVAVVRRGQIRPFDFSASMRSLTAFPLCETEFFSSMGISANVLTPSWENTGSNPNPPSPYSLSVMTPLHLPVTTILSPFTSHPMQHLNSAPLSATPSMSLRIHGFPIVFWA